MWNKRRTIYGGHCPGTFKRSPEVLPACRGVEQVRLLNQIFLYNLNNAVYSYIVELQKIAINFRFLNSDTSAKLKEATIFAGSRRIQRQRSNQTTDAVGNDEDWDLEHKLLSLNQVAVADDMIALQQFGEEIFCAPQEDILEGECNSTYLQ